jgi:predicted MFS family arabinose efflux permease
MLAHPVVWALAVVWLLTLTASYGIQFWLPQVLRDRSGTSDLGIGLLTAVPGLVAVAATVSVAAHLDTTGERCLHTALPILIGGAGLATAAISHSLPVTLLGLSLAVAGIASAHGPFWSMAPRCLGGATVAAAGIAFINSVASVGGFVGPYLMGAIKDRTQGYAAALLVLAALMLAAGTGAVLLRQRQPGGSAMAAEG